VAQPSAWRFRIERKTYVKYREEAVRLSTSVIDSQLRAVTMERIKALDAAIASVGQALEITSSGYTT
jgi:hypothetical protein